MKDYYPDPSLINQVDFYSSAFKIKMLLRRRGWNDVVPNGGDVGSFMPKNLYRKWGSYPSRQKLIKRKKVKKASKGSI